MTSDRVPTGRTAPSPGPAPAVPLRDPARVMRLARMGAFFPTRLSFMRRLLRHLSAGGAAVSRPLWEIDDDGYGRAVYEVGLEGRTFSLCCFAAALDPSRRTDRVIADAWDAVFVLHDGRPDGAVLDRLAGAAPRQEAGRFEAADLVLSRANKSVRAFEHVAGRLAQGRQPDAALIRSVGYLMRTTAVYGNGKFGIADRERVARDALLRAPFQVEMLTVYLIRAFTHDLVEHVAARRGGSRAVPLDPRLKRHLGIGNATGLGMAPFLVSHPVLLHKWMHARETALARVRAVASADADRAQRFVAVLGRARAHAAEWQVADAKQARRIDVLRRELEHLSTLATPALLAARHPWERLLDASRDWSLEAQECLVSLLLEPYPELVDDLAEEMHASEVSRLDPGMPVGRLREIAEAVFGWTAEIDFAARESTQRFWYVSQEKLEPRLGDRYAEPGADREMPLGVARDGRRLIEALAQIDPGQSTARLVLARPELRHVVRRAQTAARHPFAEIRDNLLDAACAPIDILRCKLSFFGASKFDPRSDRWTRITLYQGAPLHDELGRADADDWCFSHLVGPR